ncbi:hypothetical protein WG902_18265 [Ramlibacter sp. PS3R-8]|uniref:hypothetical protein n=1 Tax=Ramlibacter sp. PS3R-8 TaxID=3133437 RepID=UPI00309E7691
MNTELDPTGKVFLTQTSDDLGRFEVTGGISSDLLELVATGYYLDELTGKLSTAPITLTAIADTSVAPRPTVNVLTTLQAPRLKKLILLGRTYEAAFDQSAREVLLAFGMDPSKMKNFESLASMQIDGSADQDSALLAASSILAQMATTAAAGASSQASELSYLLSSIGQQLAEDGRITNSSLIAARKIAARQLDIVAVRSNVEAYYASKGLIVRAPKFEEWVDKDSSGLLPRRLLPVDEFHLIDHFDAVPGQLYRSNVVIVHGIPDGEVVPVATSGWVRLVKNGVPVEVAPEWVGYPFMYSTAVNGDTFALEAPAGAFGGSFSGTLQIGTSTSTWTLSADIPQVLAGRYRPGTSGLITQQYFAVPVELDRRTSVRFAMMAVPGSARTLSIHTDDGGKPGVQIASSLEWCGFESGSIEVPGGTTWNDPVAFLSEEGIVLEPGVKYWVVLAFQHPMAGARQYYWSSVSSAGAPVSADGQTWTLSPGPVLQPGVLLLK